MTDVIINKIQLPNDDNLYNVQDSRVDVLISDAGEQNTIRTIANNELAKALIPENAQAALDTLTEIANWIQNHPDSYAAFVAKYNAHRHSTTYRPEGTITQPEFEATEQSTGNASETADVDVSKDTHTHSGKYTPSGTIGQPTFTGDNSFTKKSATETTSVATGGHTHAVSYTPAGTISQPTFNGTEASTSGIIDASKVTVAGKEHTHTIASYTPAGTISQPTFNGTEASTEQSAKNINVPNKDHTHSVVYTPAGTVTQPTFNGTKASTSSSPGTASITVNSITSRGTLPTITWGDIKGDLNGRILTLSHTGTAFDPGTLPEYSTVTEAFASTNHTHEYTPAGTVTQPTFTGTGATITVNKTAETNLTSVTPSDHTHEYTPGGTITTPTFTGTRTTITTGESSTAHEVTVSKADHVHSYTPKGTVTAPTFTGDEGTISVNKTTDNVTVSKNGHTHKYTPTGTVTTPTFDGKEVTIEVGIPTEQASNESLEDTHSPVN